MSTVELTLDGQGLLRKQGLNCQIGVKSKKLTRELPAPTKNDFRYLCNKPMVVFAHKPQEQLVKKAYCLAYNTRDTPITRMPGMKHLRFVPDSRLTLQGQGQVAIATRGQRHKGVVEKLATLYCDSVRKLDKVMYTKDGQAHTLRAILMTSTYPMNEVLSVTNRMFHCVEVSDKAAFPGIKALAYAQTDSLDKARGFLKVLPAFIWNFYGEDFLKQWFHPNSFDVLGQVTFTLIDEEEGYTIENWDGEWTTFDSQEQDRLNSEPLPGGITIDGLEMMEEEEAGVRVLHTHVDDQSAFSFISRAQSVDSNGSADSTQATSSGSATGGLGEAGTFTGPGLAG
jgi:hypothetical protein